MSDADDLLAQREETHGEYENTARIIQSFKKVLFGELLERELRGSNDLSDVAIESVEMILHKIGRVVSGKWDCPDHWADISGYADLVSRSIENAGEGVEYKREETEPDNYDWEADALGSYNEAIKEMGDDVKAGRRELPEMFKARGRAQRGSDPGDETNF